MGRACSCCTSDRRAEIDTAIAAGATNKAIAATVGLNAVQVGRHKRRCLQVTPLSDAEQLTLLMARSEELWAMAAGNGDVRAMAQALQSSLRALEFQIRHREEEHEGKTAYDLPLDVNLWDEDDRRRFIAFLDHILLSTPMPDVRVVNGPRDSAGEEEHEHFELPQRFSN
jgi:hypothetical protein